MNNFMCGWMIGFMMATIGMALAADLPVPKKPPELCLERDKKPYPGQTLQTDKTCPTGLRWIFQK